MNVEDASSSDLEALRATYAAVWWLYQSYVTALALAHSDHESVREELLSQLRSVTEQLPDRSQSIPLSSDAKSKR
jgi:hypothetical protein